MRIERGNDPGPFSRSRDYVTHLRVLFHYRCAYCLTPDDRLGGEEGMQVDHFHPQAQRRDLILAWSNLYYCCVACNNRKSDHPLKKEVAQGLHFVDPCADDTDDHFRLARDPKNGDFCQVAHLSESAKYTIRQLQFNRRPFLRDFWRELDAEERRWTDRMQCVAELQSKLQETDPETELLLAQCTIELSKIRKRRPFPLKK
ncbi:MAG TPA: hypothetical protein DIT97_01350 [Gimesia maris]|uniref:HNH domain-containing protein n=1 Tax=Gimesia maris TaxID=122 RepID=A0A3D3QYX2_9PLAN|nr:hypothetical protein [Gimesia maris]